MGSRYLFIVLYVFLEHHLSRGDYRRDGFRRADRHGQRLEGKAASRRRGDVSPGTPGRRLARRAGH
jgi:hypothetical protein